MVCRISRLFLTKWFFPTSLDMIQGSKMKNHFSRKPLILNKMRIFGWTGREGGGGKGVGKKHYLV